MPKSQANFRRLDVWNRSLDLAVSTYVQTESLPKSETYGLQSQMRRAAVSVPANIAEGSRRHHPAEFLQSIGIALGSLAELETYYELGRRLGMGFDSDGAIAESDEIRRMLNGLRNRIEAQASEPSRISSKRK